MTNEWWLCIAYEHVISDRVDEITKKIVKKVIRGLQSYKRDSNLMLTPDDVLLDNLWDEVCIQIQGEESVYWSSYESFIYNVVSDLLEKECSMNDWHMLWLRGDEFNQWTDNTLNAEDKLTSFFDHHGYPVGFSKDSAINHVFKATFDAAADYRNARIENYLYFS